MTSLTPAADARAVALQKMEAALDAAVATGKIPQLSADATKAMVRATIDVSAPHFDLNLKAITSMRAMETAFANALATYVATLCNCSGMAREAIAHDFCSEVAAQAVARILSPNLEATTTIPFKQAHHA